MSFSDPLGDMLTRIRNGQQARKSDIKVPASKLRENVLEVLKREGYIRGYERVNLRKGIDEIKVELKYYEGRPVISEIVVRRLPDTDDADTAHEIHEDAGLKSGIHPKK